MINRASELRPYSPVIIIGAPRSGTNMLRDLICGLPNTATWDCDEINYIWRYGNRSSTYDALSTEQVTPCISAYIQSYFDKLFSQTGAVNIVEKTCANSLRIPFVNEIFPDAKFIFIVRDGRDVLRSALKRWTATVEWRYTIRKARHVPVSDIPFYAVGYLRNRMAQALSKEGILPTWGPLFEGIDTFRAQHSLEDCVAQQWIECVTSAVEALEEIPEQRKLELAYERVVACPEEELGKICQFLNIRCHQTNLVSARRFVRYPVVPAEPRRFPQMSPSVQQNMVRTLVQLGYPTDLARTAA